MGGDGDEEEGLVITPWKPLPMPQNSKQMMVGREWDGRMLREDVVEREQSDDLVLTLCHKHQRTAPLQNAKL